MLCVIGETDPGAVPGASTIILIYGGEIGSTFVKRQRLRSALYHRYRTNFINANDNRLAIAA